MGFSSLSPSYGACGAGRGGLGAAKGGAGHVLLRPPVAFANQGLGKTGQKGDTPRDEGGQGSTDDCMPAAGRRPGCGRHVVPLRRCRSEEHTSELQSLMRISYAVFCLKK